jgi:hypothetical protein
MEKCITIWSQLFFRKYSVNHNTGIRIIINAIDSQIVDTTNMVVFLTMVELLSIEFNYVISDFKLNDKGDLIIPK